MQKEIEFVWRVPTSISARPVSNHNKLGFPQTTWYYNCLNCNSGRNMHQSYAPSHLRKVHGCTKSQAKQICERSRKAYYRHRYDDDIAKWEAKHA